MGRGNWYPTPEEEKDYEVVYVDLTTRVEDVEDTDAMQWEYEDLKLVIKTYLEEQDTHWYEADSRLSNARDDNPFMTDGNYIVVFDGNGEDHHFGIGMIAAEEVQDKIEDGLGEVAKKFFDHLHDSSYDLSGRMGPWMSSEYKRTPR